MWSHLGRKIGIAVILEKNSRDFFIYIDESLETRAPRAAFVCSYLVAARASRAPIAQLHLLIAKIVGSARARSTLSVTNKLYLTIWGSARFARAHCTFQFTDNIFGVGDKDNHALISI